MATERVLILRLCDVMFGKYCVDIMSGVRAYHQHVHRRMQDQLQFLRQEVVGAIDFFGAIERAQVGGIEYSEVPKGFSPSFPPYGVLLVPLDARVVRSGEWRDADPLLSAAMRWVCAGDGRKSKIVFFAHGGEGAFFATGPGSMFFGKESSQVLAAKAGSALAAGVAAAGGTSLNKVELLSCSAANAGGDGGPSNLEAFARGYQQVSAGSEGPDFIGYRNPILATPSSRVPQSWDENRQVLLAAQDQGALARWLRPILQRSSPSTAAAFGASLAGWMPWVPAEHLQQIAEVFSLPSDANTLDARTRDLCMLLTLEDRKYFPGSDLWIMNESKEVAQRFAVARASDEQMPVRASPRSVAAPWPADLRDQVDLDSAL